MAQRGHPQTVVDEMELWVVARIVQLGTSPEDRHRAEAEAANADRVRAAQAGEQPKPAAAAPSGPEISDDEADAAITALRRARAEARRAGTLKRTRRVARKDPEVTS